MLLKVGVIGLITPEMLLNDECQRYGYLATLLLKLLVVLHTGYLYGILLLVGLRIFWRFQPDATLLLLKFFSYVARCDLGLGHI